MTSAPWANKRGPDGLRIRPASRFIIGLLCWISRASRTLLLPQLSSLTRILASFQVMVCAVFWTGMWPEVLRQAVQTLYKGDILRGTSTRCWWSSGLKRLMKNSLQQTVFLNTPKSKNHQKRYVIYTTSIHIIICAPSSEICPTTYATVQLIGQQIRHVVFNARGRVVRLVPRPHWLEPEWMALCFLLCLLLLWYLSLR